MTVPATPLRYVANNDGAAILDIEHGSITTLNPAGAFVWQGLNKGNTLDAIVADLAQETGADIMVVDRDVRGFADNSNRRISCHVDRRATYADIRSQQRSPRVSDRTCFAGFAQDIGCERGQ